MQKVVSLKDYYLIFKQYFMIILTGALIGGILAYGIMTYFVTPTYRSQVELLVNQQNEQQVVQVNEIHNNIQLVNTYRAIITGHSLLSQVDENLDNQYGVEVLQESVSVDQPAQSQTFYINALMDSPEAAQEIVSEVTAIFDGIVGEVYGEEVVIYELSPPSLETVPLAPRAYIYIAMGVVLGFFFSVVLVLFIEMMDSTVKESDFFVQEGLKNLGSVSEIPKQKKRQLHQLNNKKMPVKVNIHENV